MKCYAPEKYIYDTNITDFIGPGYPQGAGIDNSQATRAGYRPKPGLT
ncbi:MAG: hypothetical protein WBQ21_06405 [Solirubrobacteraceae bacterium]